MILAGCISKPVLQAVISELFQEDLLTKQTSAVQVFKALGKLNLFSEVQFQTSATVYLGSSLCMQNIVKMQKPVTSTICCQYIPKCGLNALVFFFSILLWENSFHSKQNTTGSPPKS